MYIDLVHTQPLFRDEPDSLVVKYTHPETGVHLEIPYDDLVNTVVAVSSLLDDGVEEAEAVVHPPLPPQQAVAPAAMIEDQVLSGAPSGLRVMRSHIPDSDV